MKGKERKRRDMGQRHRLRRCEVGRLKLYRTLARDLARRAEWGSLTLSGLDLGAAMRGQYRGLPGVGRPNFDTMMMQILHQEQMKLDNHRRPDYQPATQPTSAETRRQSCSTSAKTPRSPYYKVRNSSHPTKSRSRPSERGEEFAFLRANSRSRCFASLSMTALWLRPEAAL